jgi:putative DNA primase/helicase
MNAETEAAQEARVGRLRFTNGTLDIATSTFTAIDKATSTRSGQDIPRKYAGRPDDAFMQKVRRALFEEAFNGDQPTTRFVCKALGRALAGDRADVMYFWVGEPGAGKSFLSHVLTAALGPALSGNFDGHNALGIVGASKPRRIMKAIAHTRIVFIDQMQGRLDGNFIRSVTGGDPIQVCGRDEQLINARATVFGLGNWVPLIEPFDDGIMSRIRCIPFPRKLGSDWQGMQEMRRNMWSAEWQDAVLHLLIDGYQAYLTEGLVVPDAVMQATQEWLAPRVWPA